MRFEITADGIEGASHRLNRLGDQAGDLRPVFEEIYLALLAGERKLFARNGGGGRNNWAANQPSTLARKASQHLDLRPMRATGSLETSLTVPHAAGQIIEIRSDSLRFGTKLKQGAINQFAKGERKRVVFSINGKPKKTMKELFSAHLSA